MHKTLDASGGEPYLSPSLHKHGMKNLLVNLLPPVTATYTRRFCTRHSVNALPCFELFFWCSSCGSYLINIRHIHTRRLAAMALLSVVGRVKASGRAGNGSSVLECVPRQKRDHNHASDFCPKLSLAFESPRRNWYHAHLRASPSSIVHVAPLPPNVIPLSSKNDAKPRTNASFYPYSPRQAGAVRSAVGA